VSGHLHTGCFIPRKIDLDSSWLGDRSGKEKGPELQLSSPHKKGGGGGVNIPVTGREGP
jgi:hypothetical protein